MSRPSQKSSPSQGQLCAELCPLPCFIPCSSGHRAGGNVCRDLSQSELGDEAWLLHLPPSANRILVQLRVLFLGKIKAGCVIKNGFGPQTEGLPAQSSACRGKSRGTKHQLCLPRVLPSALPSTATSWDLLGRSLNPHPELWARFKYNYLPDTLLGLVFPVSDGSEQHCLIMCCFVSDWLNGFTDII